MPKTFERSFNAYDKSLSIYSIDRFEIFIIVLCIQFLIFLIAKNECSYDFEKIGIVNVASTNLTNNTIVCNMTSSTPQHYVFVIFFTTFSFKIFRAHVKYFLEQLKFILNILDKIYPNIGKETASIQLFYIELQQYS